MDVVPDATLAGRYRLIRLIGEGGMGSVWAATHIVTRKVVALKLLKEEHASDPRTRQRFVREARAASAVSHPNVVEIHDVVELDDGTPVMVMELLEGESLGHRLDREGRIPLRELAQLLMPVVSAVGTAHAAGIVHRDLKPDNIFLSTTATEGVVVKVLDFGIAKLTAVEGQAQATAGLTGTGAMLGTPYYMAPEQIFGERDIDHRADIWALGIILYECLSGVRPTEGENIGQIMKIVTRNTIKPLEQLCPELPKDVTDLVNRMLTSDRAGRPESLREVSAGLRRYADIAVMSFNDPTHARPSLTGLPDASASNPKITGSDALAATLDMASLHPGPPGQTLSSTTKDRTDPPRRSVLPLAAGGILLLAAGGAIAFFAIPRPSSGQATPATVSTVASVAPVQQPPPSQSQQETPQTPQTPLTPAATVSQAQVQTAPPVHSAKPRPSASVAPTVATAPQPSSNLGGVVDKPPF